MSDHSTVMRPPASAVKIAVMLAVFWVILKAYAQWPTIMAQLASGDNDDIMRLLSVRDWLAGQGWFDTTQYRLLEPVGMSMHWSRYVDAGIAALLVPLSLVMPVAMAEQITLIAWPTLLLILLIVIVARVTNRLLGPVAACAAVASVVFWLPTGELLFKAGRIDHHNVQVLMMVTLAYAMIRPGNSIWRGVIGGLAAAFSLVVGLETLPFMALAWLIMAVRGAMQGGEAQRLLAAFCVTLIVAGIVLYAGQTHPSIWLHTVCDELSPPFLAIMLVAAVAGVAPMALPQRPALRLGATAVIAGIGLALAAPLLLQCKSGPYGILPPDLQAVITTQISEALPGHVFALLRPLSFNSIITPVFFAVILAAAIWFKQRGQPGTPAVENAAVAQMLIFGCLGLLGSIYQIRMNILAAPAVPFLTGYVIHHAVQARLAHPSARRSLALAATVLLTVLAPKLNGPAMAIADATMPAGGAAQVENRHWDKGCRSLESLKALNILPPSRIATTMSMGTTLMLATHHRAMSAPYHRNPDAIWNGVYPLQSAENMQRALRKGGADYLVLCAGTTYGDARPLAAALLRGDPVPWLRPVQMMRDDLVVFQVVKSALAP